MNEHLLDVTLTVRGPVLTRSTAFGGYGVDAPVARGRHGRPILPGSLVKGKLREAWEELAAAEALAVPVDDWLGHRNEEASWLPERGRTRISDFEAAGGERRRRYRIQLDPETGAVAQQALQVVETPFAPGQEVAFTGSVGFVPRDDEERAAFERALGLGLRWIGSFGALRTVGFGRLLEVEISPAEAPQVTSAEGLTGDRAELVLTPRDPLLISRHQPVPNLHQGADQVPGGVLKGALASTWNESLGQAPDAPVSETTDPNRRELGRHFEAIRFTHAFPAPKAADRRPVTPPLSLVKVKLGEKSGDEDDPLFDVLHLDGPALIGGRAPEFAIDWKRRDDVDRRFGWRRPERELRVRTAIDSATRRAADEELFAHETVLPDEETVWLGRMDLSRVPEKDRPAVFEQLTGLLTHGLRHLGKTKARATVELRLGGEVGDACEQQPLGEPGPWALTLQTPALLCDPRRLAGAPPGALRTVYAEVFRALSGGSLELVRFFARQHLAGGRYLHQRFQSGKPYEPFLLTEAGSVFLLAAAEGQEKKARERLKSFARHGLPLPPWAVERYACGGHRGDHWQANPYLPENGWGEAAVELAVHRELEPPADQVELLETEAAS